MAVSAQLLMAARDRRLNGRALRVLTYLQNWLVEDDARPIKVQALATQLYSNPFYPRLPTRSECHGIANAVQDLVRAGYLAVGSRYGLLKTYRLCIPPLTALDNTRVTNRAA